MSLGTIAIASRFRGPPASGNGGYVAGRLAAFVPTEDAQPAIVVRLAAPPPLETALEVRSREHGVGLFDEERCVATARPVALELSPPTPPGIAATLEAARAYRGFDEHPLPGCFVCGVDRAEGDGLRIFPGPTGGDGLFAAPWTPDESLRAVGDVVEPAFVWAALDCPGAFSFPQVDGICLLGELRVRLLGDVRVGESCVVTSWSLANDGRKHTTGTAIYGGDGDCLGYARAAWIHVDADSVPRD